MNREQRRRELLSKIKPLPADADTSEIIYTASRVEDLPNPPVPSAQFDCEDCHKKVWIDKRSVKLAVKCKAIICLHCVVSRESA